MPGENGDVSSKRESREELAKLQTFSSHWSCSQMSIRAYLASFLYDRLLLDDCLQEVAMVAWQKAPLDQGQKAFLGYCLTCARLISLAMSRKQSRTPLQFMSPEIAQALADTVERQELADDRAQEFLAALRHCLGNLAEKQRQLLVLRYAPDGSSSLKSEAARHGKSLDSLYKKLERLRILLRECVTSRTDGME